MYRGAFVLGVVTLLAGCVGNEAGLTSVPDAPRRETVGDAPGTGPAEQLPQTYAARAVTLLFEHPNRYEDPEQEPEEPDEPAEEPDRPNGEVLFEPDTLQDIAIELSDTAMQSLRDAPTVEVAGTVEWRGERYAAAVRLKGSASFQPIDEKPSFKIDVHAYDPEQELDGLERLTLNNMKQDGSMLREHAYYWLATRLGIPAPRHGYARVTVNGAAYGVYGIVETLDEQFVKRAFPDDHDGNLYEADPADFLRGRDWWSGEEDGGVVPYWDDLDDLVDTVDDTPASAFDAMLSDQFERDRVLDFLALDMVAGNRDGYVYNYHNYLAYHGALSDRWALIPWGTDQSFRHDGPPLGTLDKPAEGHLFVMCWDDPTCGPELRERALAVLDIWETELPDVVDAARDLVEDACDEDPRRDKSCSHDDVVDYVDWRADFLRPYL